jgi:carbonic anhydrase
MTANYTQRFFEARTSRNSRAHVSRDGSWRTAILREEPADARIDHAAIAANKEKRRMTTPAKLAASLLLAGTVWGVLSRGEVPNSYTEPPAVHGASSVTAEQALHRLQAGNARFAANARTAHNLGPHRRQELADGQTPFAVVLACADSRVAPELIFDQGLGDIFVVRVAGNIADPYTLGSVEYAVEHLHVPLVVLLGHEKCGAVEAALGQSRPAGNLGKVIAEVHPGAGLPETPSKALAVAVVNNARYQAHMLTERSAVLRTQVDKKKLRIVTAVYHLASGKVEWLDAK